MSEMWCEIVTNQVEMKSRRIRDTNAVTGDPEAPEMNMSHEDGVTTARSEHLSRTGKQGIELVI